MSKRERRREAVDPSEGAGLGSQEGGITKTGMKKTIWVHHDEAEALRDASYRLRRPESSIIREAIRRYLKLED